jgi:O-antigen/teichoic acid export membrane protein
VGWPRRLPFLRGLSELTIRRVGWTAVVFAFMQIIRLANNVILTRLLAPPIFGLITIVFTIKTGMELLSDAGISQNIVANKKGSERDFYDTAWTVQVIRGVLLATLCVIFSSSFARFFDEPQLAAIMPVIALLFVFAGLQSTSRALFQKKIWLVRADLFELAVLIITVVIQITLAWFYPTVWALVLGALAASAIGLVASYLLMPGLSHRFYFHSTFTYEILHFSKWIFLSTAVYFFAWNFDRLYFAKQISLAELGIFSIARGLTDLIGAMAGRASGLLLMPAVASMDAENYEIRGKVLHSRRILLLLVAIGLGGLVSVSDVVVQILYDRRYEAAGQILPLLLIATWFYILTTINDSILLGTSKPAFPAFANGAKLATLVVGVPIAFIQFGFMAAIIVLIAGEVMRYVVLWAFSRRKHLAFGRDDLGLTIVFVLSAIAARELLAAIGLTGNILSLFPMVHPEYWTA